MQIQERVRGIVLMGVIIAERDVDIGKIFFVKRIYGILMNGMEKISMQTER